VRPEEAARILALALAARESASPDDSAAPERLAAPEGFAAPGAEPTAWLRPDEVAGILAAYGIPTAEGRLVDTPEAAGGAAAELGGPVALKAVAPGVLRKREAGGVVLSLVGAPAVERAAREMAAALAAAGHPVDGFLVQRMVAGGVEMLVGVVHDRMFGPVIACGAGGSEIALLRDVVVRITPLTDRDAGEMLRSLAIYPLLEGYRDAPREDVAALEEVLLRVSAMVEAHPEIVEMDCNPVIVLPTGAVVVDARIRIQASSAANRDGPAGGRATRTTGT
jgi:acyl-CoA synthetase (NDP forming)